MNQPRAQPSRVRLTKWVSSGSIAARIEVDAVVLEEDPGTPCLEPSVLRLLDEAQRLANEGNADALARLGTVYVRRTA
jgi:hypothetical protein